MGTTIVTVKNGANQSPITGALVRLLLLFEGSSIMPSDGFTDSLGVARIENYGLPITGWYCEAENYRPMGGNGNPPTTIYLFPSSKIITILSLGANKYQAFPGEQVTLIASLTTDQNAPIANKQIKFYIGGQFAGSSYTDGNGVARLTTTFQPGTWTAYAIFNGDDYYEGC